MTTTFPNIPTNPESWLPISSSSRTRCVRCGEQVGVHHVIDPWANWRPICTRCVARHEHEDLLDWQNLADVYGALDRFFNEVPDVAQRQAFLDLIASHAQWMANWRWPDDKVISIQPPVPDVDNFDDEDD